MTRSTPQAPKAETLRLAHADHGGNLAAATRAFPSAPRPWLDLSTGINPFAYPVPDLPLELFARLPEPEALRGLEQAAGRAYRAAEPCQVVAAPGTQSIIGLLPLLRPARRVGILGSTYSEHANAWHAGGAEVTSVEDLCALEAMDVAVVVNPNNPDGRFVAVEHLRALSERLGRRGGLLILDEAFADFSEPAASLVPLIGEAPVVVLRSFGKAFGLAGLRLGFAVTGATIAARLRSALGPWPVGGAAIAIGRGALADAAWLVAIREKLRAEGAELDAVLTDAGFTMLGKTALFRLVAHERAAQKFEALGRAGIFVRRFESRPNRLRFGIPAGEIDRDRLRAALGSG